ncbi:NUDIX domain-containing protein [Candidatus Uhrbacteria bacterium]|nr:NUDIX domain-containing protein [Candidatus Uhrbacteria bacterium]
MTLKKRPLKKAPNKKEPAEREVSAGGIVFKRKGTKVWIAMMQDPYGKWAFPKGHVEGDEAVEEAAARETLEELGLEQVRLLEELGKIDIWFRDRYQKKGKLIHKDIHYFLFETPGNANLHPDPQEHVLAAKWVPMAGLLKESSYPDMVPVLRRALTHLRALGKSSS